MQNVEQMQDLLGAGTAIAGEAPAELAAREPLATLDGLLHFFPKRPGTRGPAIRSAATKFLDFIGYTAEETPIHLLETERERFVDYLRNRRHTQETVRSYSYCINLLLKKAREQGWQIPPQVLPPDWAAVMALARKKELQSIVRYAVKINKSPSTFTEDDLKAWCQTRVQAGRSLLPCRSNATLFRSLMSRPELSHLKPLVRVAPARYGTPLRKMHESLRKEVEDLLSYLTEELEFERTGPPLRQATADGLRTTFERLVGFIENIQGGSRVEALSGILTKATITEYIKWAVKERGVIGETLFTNFSRLHATFKKHPRYASLDLRWLPDVLEKLHRSTRTEIDRRKLRKYISFEAADSIPGKIREARTRSKNQTEFDVAISLRNELLMLWLVVLAWRQRNLRECRLFGGPHANLFVASIPTHSLTSQPIWLQEQEKHHPGKLVWQIYFTPDETKSKNEVKGFLPAELATLLEEYLKHRQALIPSGAPDPGTLFVNEDGNAINRARMTNLVQSLSSTYAGAATNPHLFRDIVAYEWLKNHPQDFLTLSKLLWHKSVEYTLTVYGSRFNESTGIARMDDWRASRKKAA
jgi:integrase